MAMLSQPSAVTSENQFVGVLSPFYVVGEYNNNTWNRLRVDLWIWKGAHTAATSRNPDYVLSKNKLNIDDIKVEINIADYIADTINPVFTPFNGDTNNSDRSFFYYEVRYFNDNTQVYVQQSPLRIGTLGWRYDYQNFGLGQENGPEFFPNGTSNSEFGFFNLNSKLNYFKYSDEMVDTNSHLWFTNISLPINNVTTSPIYYTNLVAQLNPDQIICSPYNYGIGFINKAGNWDMIPMFGKVNINTEKNSVKYNRGFRYKTDFNDRYQNSVREVSNFESVTYTINTGRMSELMSKYLETIVFSPRLFVVDYDANLYYPVTLESTTFATKNKTNDKSNIQHTLVFKGDNSKMLKY